MSPEELLDTLHHRPFEPFRLVMTDGGCYDIRHPELLLVGKRTATIGLTVDPNQTLYERTVKIDLLHVIRLEPLKASPISDKNGPG